MGEPPSSYCASLSLSSAISAFSLAAGGFVRCVGWGLVGELIHLRRVGLLGV